jgi:DNA-binding MarR family transcriptional regulator
MASDFPELTLELKLGLALHEVAALLRQRFEQRARAEQLGLTRAQASVLSRLARNEGINQATLAQMLEIEPITLVRLLDRLQAAGMVERRSDPADRRMHSLRLTPQARPMVARIRALYADVVEDSLAGVPGPVRTALLETLLSIKSNLCESAQESSSTRRGTANG